MERRTGLIVAVVVTALLCGIPGVLAILCAGVVSFTAVDPGPSVGLFERPVGWALGLVCVGALAILIPLIVGAYAIRERQREQPKFVDVDFDEPVPPPL